MNDQSRRKRLNRLISLGAASALIAGVGAYAANDNQNHGASQGAVNTESTTDNRRTGDQVGTTQQDRQMTTRQQERDASEDGDPNVLVDRDEEGAIAETTGEESDLAGDDSSVADTDEEEDDSGWFHPRSRGTTATEDVDWLEDEDDREDELADTDDQQDRESLN